MKMLHTCHFQNSIETEGDQTATVSETFNMSWPSRFLGATETETFDTISFYLTTGQWVIS
jgi:hypothetical protein